MSNNPNFFSNYSCAPAHLKHEIELMHAIWKPENPLAKKVIQRRMKSHGNTDTAI
jgi:hypothetical protein